MSTPGEVREIRLWLDPRALRLPLIQPTAEYFYDFVLAPLIWGWNQRRRAQLASAQRIR